MKDMNLLQSRLINFLENDLHLVVPSPSTDLFESGGMDSMIFVELLLLLEREFGIKVDLQRLEFDDFRSVNSITRLMAGFLPEPVK